MVFIFPSSPSSAKSVPYPRSSPKIHTNPPRPKPWCESTGVVSSTLTSTPSGHPAWNSAICLVECVDADDLVLPTLLQEPDTGTTRQVEELAPLRGVALVPGRGIPTCELVGSGHGRRLYQLKCSLRTSLPAAADTGSGTYARLMIVGEATTTVAATPNDVFDFVLDLNRYRQADHKIGRVGTIDNQGDRGMVRFSGRIRGLPGPSGTYPFTRTESHLRFGSPVAGPARWFLDFEGTFDTEQSGDESAWDQRVLLTLETRMMEHGNHRCAAEAAEVSGRAA